MLNSGLTISDICSKETVNYTATSATSGTTFSWTRTAISGISEAASSGSDEIINETLTNTTNSPIPVTYVFTLIADGCPNKQSVTVIVNPLPSISISNNNALCVRDTNTLAVSPSGGSWKSLDLGIAIVNASTGLVTGISGGTATIRYTVTSSDGCTDSMDVQVTIKSLPILSILGSSSICLNTTTLLSANEAGSWASLNNSVATVNSSTGLVTGVGVGSTRFVFTSSVTGCNDTTTAVTVGTFPSVDPITAVRDATCVGMGVQLTGSPAGGVWSLSNGNADFSSPSSPLANPVTIEGITTGGVYVTYTVGSGACQSNSTYYIKVLPQTAPTVIIGFER
jgi:hypothetical protein